MRRRMHWLAMYMVEVCMGLAIACLVALAIFWR